MPGKRGYSTWDTEFIFEFPWLDDDFMIRKMPPIDWNDALGVIPLQTHAGTHKIQRIYRGDKAPQTYDAMSLTFAANMISETDYYRLRRIVKRGDPFWWSQGLRVVEVFDAVSGSTYTLSRPLASGVVTGVDETSHPTVIRLDGIVNAGAATISGSPQQTVTANATGELAIEYTPVHRVVVTEFPGSVAALNALSQSVTFTEIIEGDFS